MAQIGEQNHRAKLTENDVRQIRKHYARGNTQQAIAVAYGVSLKAIWKILTGKAWTHVR